MILSWNAKYINRNERRSRTPQMMNVLKIVTLIKGFISVLPLSSVFNDL